MAYVALEDHFQMIKAEATACPDEHILQAFIMTARDWCDFTRSMQYEAPAATILLGVSDYAMAVESNGLVPPTTFVEPIAVEFMQVDDFPCYFRTVNVLEQKIANWRYRSADDFRFFTTVRRGYFTFPCVPTKNGTANGVRYRVSQRPKIDAEELDDAFLNEYLGPLSDGTKARLLMEEGKTWYKPKRGVQLEGAYRHARGLERIRVNKSYGNSDDSLTIPRFA